jgi:hypothetical protein
MEPHTEPETDEGSDSHEAEDVTAWRAGDNAGSEDEEASGLDDRVAGAGRVGREFGARVLPRKGSNGGLGVGESSEKGAVGGV